MAPPSISPGEGLRAAAWKPAGELNVKQSWATDWAGRKLENDVGLNADYRNRARLGGAMAGGISSVVPASEDRQRQGRVGLFFQSRARWYDTLSTVVDVRTDFFRSNVSAGGTGDGRGIQDYTVSPRFSVVFAPWKKTQHYFNLGYGIQNPDMRAATGVRETSTLNPGEPWNQLVRARGAETGIRSNLIPRVETGVALWRLDLGSEPLLARDYPADSRPAVRREGAEWTNFWTAAKGLMLDADMAVFRSRSESSIPDPAIDARGRVASVGFTMDMLRNWFGGVRWRYFERDVLSGDNSVRADSSSTVNLRVGYKLDKQTRLTMDVLNVFGYRASDLDYGYEWRMAPRAGAAFDMGAHAGDARAVRISLGASF